MTSTSENLQSRIVPTGPATALLPGGPGHGPPITIIGTDKIRSGFDGKCLQQAINARYSPGVSKLVLNPDGHAGYGAPVGCVMASPTHIYPGPVGVDVKCSMSLLQFNLPADQIDDRKLRRALINAITDRIPTGAGAGLRAARKPRRIDPAIARAAVIQGASPEVCASLGLPQRLAAALRRRRAQRPRRHARLPGPAPGPPPLGRHVQESGR